ncbi:hypothetical protein Trydic_g986 [Trypoxylus dichotomus]
MPNGRRKLRYQHVIWICGGVSDGNFDYGEGRIDIYVDRFHDTDCRDVLVLALTRPPIPLEAGQSRLQSKHVLDESSGLSHARAFMLPSRDKVKKLIKGPGGGVPSMPRREKFS